MLKDSIFAIDKDLFLGEVITLKIIWNQSTRIAFNGTDITDPDVDTEVLGANINISNLALFLATETNLDIINQLRATIRISTCDPIYLYFQD